MSRRNATLAVLAPLASYHPSWDGGTEAWVELSVPKSPAGSDDLTREIHCDRWFTFCSRNGRVLERTMERRRSAWNVKPR
jgi:hypothetical protein